MKKLLILMSLIPTFIFSNSWHFDNSLGYNYIKYPEKNKYTHNLLYNFKIGQDRKDIEFKWGLDTEFDLYNTAIYTNSTDIRNEVDYHYNIYLNYKSKKYKYTKFTVDLQAENENKRFQYSGDLFETKIGHETTFNNKIQLYNRLHINFAPALTFVPDKGFYEWFSLNSQVGLDIGLNIPINDNLQFKIYSLGLLYNISLPITQDFKYIQYQILTRLGLEYKNKIFTYEPSIQYEYFKDKKQIVTAKILNFDINPNDKLNIKLNTDFIYQYDPREALTENQYNINGNFDIAYKFKKNKFLFEPKLGLEIKTEINNSSRDYYRNISNDIIIKPTVNSGYEIIDNLVLYTDLTLKVILKEHRNNYNTKYNYFYINYDAYAKLGIKYNW